MSGKRQEFFDSRLSVLWAWAVVLLTSGFGFHSGSHLSAFTKLALQNCC